ncbi:hypothetical protein F5Y08DRAFT_349757 [Xylaria arbuscula]|nr:hypothetical protein F5Y08DRAFT_349757 [Xylaria arbuscula]
MKFLAVIFTLAVTTSAYRCKFDRFSGSSGASFYCGAFEENHKAGDQTESDGCSKVHTNSCYKRHHGTTGDANCRLVIYYGNDRCVSDRTLTLSCGDASTAQIYENHSYKVYCD